MDASHWEAHLSEEAKRRSASLVKALYRFFRPGMQSLGGGLPAPEMFPVSKVSFEVPVPTDHMPESEGVPKMPINLYNGVGPEGQKSTVCLSEAQQYAALTLFPPLLEALTTLTREIHNPPSAAGHGIVGTLGNTDGLNKAFRTILNPGDNCLFEEHCFGPPTEQCRAMGCGIVPVRLDPKDGLDAEHMDHLLTNWSESHGPKPRVLYTITTGQNPTGTTPPLHRLKAIYSVCQKHDVVIVEDDPYHFLQFSPYGSQKVSEVDSSQPLTPTAEESAVKQKSISTFANTLTKSLLSIDVDGRVVRIDTFSKVIFPGARLGWVTCNQVFKERIERITEVTTQVGNGVNQAFFSQLLTEPSKEGSNTGGWGITGLLRWINQIRREYEDKRDLFVETLEHELPASLNIAHTVAPQAGMFCWIQVNVETHPRFKVNPSATGNVPKTNTVELINQLFEELSENNCLVLPASYFSAPHQLPAGVKQTTDLLPPLDDRGNFFRATFAGSRETIKAALAIFGRVMKQSWGV